MTSAIDLSTLDGSNGFVLNGIDSDDSSGYSVSVGGDINGDGFDDIIISANFADPNGISDAGETYVVFGSNSGFSSSFNLSGLNGSNGFVLNGIDGSDGSGTFLSSGGDINGDGFDDIIIGAAFADPNGTTSGETYVVFGSNSGFSSSFNLSGLNGSNGFVINGINIGDRSGISVSSGGDINGDGFDDIIIGAENAFPNGTFLGGESYVVFGSNSGFSPSFNLSGLNGSNGFVINGIDEYDYSGTSVSGGGDINGDGFDDIIIGAYGGNSYAGESYVVFGSNSGFSSSFNLSSLNGSNGFVINGIDEYDFSGSSVSSAGDVNGDGIDDVIIGANFASPNSNSGAGESYVVFGSNSGFSSSFNLSSLNGSNGFVINGIDEYDFSGSSVSSAGDVNGDGIDDVIIGANFASPNSNSGAGESYVVFGSSSGFSSSFNLSSLNGSNGFVLNGIDTGDGSGSSVSGAGDVNGDGIDDIIIAALNADPNGNSRAGESYVVFGSNSGFSSSFNLSGLNGSNGFVLNGIDVLDLSGRSVSGGGDINGDGSDDIIIGAIGGDPNGNSFAGETYVVFGLSSNTAPIANDDAVTTDEDTAVPVITVLANDTDVDNDPLTVTGFDTTGTVGTVTDNGDGTFSYDPNGQFESLNDGDTATDSFTYTITDGTDSDTATVTVTINGVTDNTAPDAVDDTATTDEDTAISVITVLANDSDVDNDPLTVTGFDTTGTVGTVINNGDGTFSYDPNGQFEALNTGNVATDSFTYTITDGTETDTATVTVTINGVTDNTAPDAVDDTATTDEDTAISVITVLANDSDVDNDPLTVTGFDTTGTVGTVINNGDGTFSYDPNGQFEALNTGNVATDSFTYTITDGTETDTATVTVTINGVTDNTAPDAVDDTATTDEDTAISVITVLANDSDVDNDPLTVTGFDTTGTVGTVINNGDGTFSYDPNGQFEALNTGNVATDSFTYTITDGTETDTATVTVTINGVDEPLNLVGTNQKDTLIGGGGNDTISGGNAPDELYGGAGNDIIGGNGNGTNGPDLLDGGLGNDTLTGGNGPDLFVLAEGEGTDTITDFQTPDEIGLAGGLSFSDLSFSGSDIIVTSTSEVLATLTGVDATTLTSSDFTTV